jgi:hypothetical protein
MKNCNYSYNISDLHIAIADLNRGGTSVTNCIEDVVTEIAEINSINPNTLKIVYRDSEGVWDGWDNKKQEFILIGETSEKGALEKYFR